MGPWPSSAAPDFAAQRAAMVVRQLRERGIRDERVLRAMGALPRELFVTPEERARAYEDNALPLAEGATISQPYVVAAMTEALGLGGTEKVLEIGAGSGYQSALLAELCGEVHAVELDPELARSLAARLEAFGYHNVQVHAGDGRLGWDAAAPYDAVLCAAATSTPSPAWLVQLREGGVAVVPLGGEEGQILCRLVKRRGRWQREDLFPVRFVPLRAPRSEDEP